MVNSLRIFAEVNENCIQTSIHRLVKVEAMTEKEVYEFLSRFLKLLITEPYNDLPRLIGVETGLKILMPGSAHTVQCSKD